MRTVRRRASTSQRAETTATRTSGRQLTIPLDDGTLQLAVVQALIPIGLLAVHAMLDAEVIALAGDRYTRTGLPSGIVRWGSQPGSIYLADQKLPIQVPRVRDRVAGREIPLGTYQQLQTPRAADLGLFRRVLGGLSCREYEGAAEAVPEAFGLAKSSVSRRFIRTSARALQQVQERRHDDREWLVLVLDGKTFAREQLVIALGVTTTGEKRILGVVQTATENKRVGAAFLRELVERGVAPRGRLLVVLDGGKGLRAGVEEVFGERAVIQRCQWHKRENVVSYLPTETQAAWRRKLEAAYAYPAYADAKRALHRRHQELLKVNGSAAASLLEGLEETLTLHRLNVFPELGASFRTTNVIESVMARVEAKTARVTRWRNGDQKLRWCAAALLAAERQFRRVKGHAKLGLLQRALGKSAAAAGQVDAA
jgi:putative transposase